MSELTKNQLKTDNSNSFPNNNTGYITPSILRDFNVNMIDSLVDEVSYTSDSSSFNQRINALDPSGSATAIAALEAATASLNTYTASNDVKWNTLGGKTGSYATTGSNTFIGNQTITGSLTISGSTTQVGNNTLTGTTTLSGSVFVSGNITLANGSDLITHDITAAGSNGLEILANNLATIVTMGQGGGTQATFAGGISAASISSSGNITGNLVGTASFATSASYAANANIDTSSFAKTNVNNSFNGTQTFNNVQVNGTASVALLNVTYESASVIYSSGSNIFGDASNDTQTLFGTVKLPSGPFSATGSFSTLIPTASSESQIDLFRLPSFVGANGTTYTAANISLFDYASSGIDQTFTIEYGNASFEKYSAMYVGPSRTQFIVGTGTGFDYDVIELIDNNNNTTTAKVKSDTIILQGNTGVTGSLVVEANATINGTTTLGNATTDTTTINGSTTINGNGEATVALNIVSGSVEIVGPRGNGGHFYSNLPITSSEGRINGTFIAKDLIVSGTWGGAGSGSLTVEKNTRLGSDFNTDTHIISGAVSIQGSLTANGNNIINSINSLTNATGSYAKTNTTNTFSANQTINGTLTVNSPTASNESQIDYIKLPTFTAANGTSYTNAAFSLFDYSSAGIDQTFGIEYANASFEKYSALYVGPSRTQFLVGTGTGFDYDVIELLDNNNNTTTAKVKADTVILQGGVQVTGSVGGNVTALSISSNTASLNLNNGNFFTLQLVSGSATHINPSNIKPGQTINIRVNTTGSATVTFPSSVDQVSGSSYVPTTTTGVDILTLVSFDSSTLYLANVKNLV